MTRVLAAHVSLALAALLALAGAGCSDDPITEIVVVVDTDLRVPEDIDAIRIDVTGLTGGARTASAPLDGRDAVELPVVLGLVHSGGPLGPISVTATGTRRDMSVVSRDARTSFVQDQVVVLRLDLVASCRSASCGTGQSCSPDGCVPIDIAPSNLAAWTGTAPRLRDTDAGVPGGDGGAPADAGGLDAGRPDAGRPDAGSSDAGSDCVQTYAMGLRGFVVCSEDATSCTFSTSSNRDDCDTLCGRGDANCRSAYARPDSAMTCSTAMTIACDATAPDGVICDCGP